MVFPTNLVTMKNDTHLMSVGLNSFYLIQAALRRHKYRFLLGCSSHLLYVASSCLTPKRHADLGKCILSNRKLFYARIDILQSNIRLCWLSIFDFVIKIYIQKQDLVHKLETHK